MAEAQGGGEECGAEGAAAEQQLVVQLGELMSRLLRFLWGAACTCGGGGGRDAYDEEEQGS